MTTHTRPTSTATPPCQLTRSLLGVLQLSTVTQAPATMSPPPSNGYRTPIPALPGDSNRPGQREKEMAAPAVAVERFRVEHGGSCAVILPTPVAYRPDVLLLPSVSRRLGKP